MLRELPFPSLAPGAIRRITVLSGCFFAAVVMGAEVGEVHLSAASVGVYEMVEVTFEADGVWVNPFDPDQVVVDLMVLEPDGTQRKLPAFYFQDYERREVEGEEKLEKKGGGTWKARFTPSHKGRHYLKVVARDRRGVGYSKELPLESRASRKPGFLRISSGAIPRFYLEPNLPFFAIGENLCWTDQGGTYTFDRLYDKLHKAQANMVRVWMGPFNRLVLERPGIHSDWRPGQYDMAAAWRLDHLLRRGEELGLLHMLVFDSFNSLRKTPPHPGWRVQPYSKENGGPLEGPEAFFSDADVRRLYRNRLRYIVARWASFPSLAIWEFWNEVDLAEGFDLEQVRGWHKEMATCLRRWDAYDHPITTSFARWEGFQEIDCLDEIEILQTHMYGRPKFSELFMDASRDKRDQCKGKPHWTTEFGTGYPSENLFGLNPWEADPDGRCLREGLWAGLFSGDVGGGLSWYWLDYVDKLDLYGQFRALAGFLEGIALHQEPWLPRLGKSAWIGDPPHQKLPAVSLDLCEASWEEGPTNEPISLFLDQKGSWKSDKPLSGILHGLGNHPALHNPVTFHVDLPSAGELILDIQGVSGHGGALIQVWLDERLVEEYRFTDADGAEQTDTIHQYDGPHSADLPKGRHKVLVRNQGQDWAYVAYQIRADFTPPVADPRVHLLSARDKILGWIVLDERNWFHRARGVQVDGKGRLAVEIDQVLDGKWQVVWMDPVTNKALGTAGYLAASGTLSAYSPPFEFDLAFRAERMK